MAASEITSVALIEYDTNDDVMLAWTYPGVSPEQQQLLIARAEMTEETNVPFSFGKYKGDWHYIYTVDVEPDSDVLQDVQSVSLCVLATAFNPEKYYALLKILASEYLVNGEAVYIMQNILKCITKGSCGPKEDTWEFSKFVNKHAYLANCSLKKIVKKFGLHSILLWAATMLRKRVVVLGPDWESVFVIVRALPPFVWHRQNWDILWPQVCTFLPLAAAAAAAEPWVMVRMCLSPRSKARPTWLRKTNSSCFSRHALIDVCDCCFRRSADRRPSHNNTNQQHPSTTTTTLQTNETKSPHATRDRCNCCRTRSRTCSRVGATAPASSTRRCAREKTCSTCWSTSRRAPSPCPRRAPRT